MDDILRPEYAQTPLAVGRVYAATLRVPSGHREVIAIEERPKGDLVITLKRPAQIGPVLGPWRDIKQHRFSIHPSPASPGFLFKMTNEFDDGELWEDAAYVRPIGKTLVWPVFADRPADLSDQRYQPSAKKEIVHLGYFEPATAAPLYILVARNGSAEPSGQYRNCLRRTFIGQCFSIDLYLLFLNAPSIDRGNLAYLATSHRRINRVDPEPIFPEGAKSFDNERLSDFVRECQRATTESYRELVYLDDPDLRHNPWFLQLSMTYTNWPLAV